MEISVDLTEQDLRDFGYYHHSHSKSSQRAKWGCAAPLFMWTLFWFWICLSDANPVKTATTLAPLLWGGPLSLITLFLLWGRGAGKQTAQEQKALLGLRQIVITPEGLTESGATRISTAQWKGVENVVIGDKAIYIYVSGLSAYIIPHHSFTSDADYDAFAHTVQDYWQKAAQ